jgi:predicted ester cyclase
MTNLPQASDRHTIDVAMAREDIVGLFARRSAAWAARDAAALAATHALNGVVVSPTGGVLEGRADIERVYRVWLSAFPDLVFKSEELIIDGNRVVEMAHLSGTHTGEFFGAAPSGRRMGFAAAIVTTVENGEITHERRILDFTGVLVQVGVLKAKPV